MTLAFKPPTCDMNKCQSLMWKISVFLYRQNILKVKKEREDAELEKKKLEERLAKFEEDAKRANEGTWSFRALSGGQQIS